MNVPTTGSWTATSGGATVTAIVVGRGAAVAYVEYEAESAAQQGTPAGVRPVADLRDLWGPADGLELSGMRIRDTYADGIDFTYGTRNSRLLNIPGVTIWDTEIAESTDDGIQFKGGGTMPSVAITNVRIDKSNNGAGILTQGSARGNATLTNITITNSSTGDIVVEPGSSFTITGGSAFTRRVE